MGLNMFSLPVVVMMMINAMLLSQGCLEEERIALLQIKTSFGDHPNDIASPQFHYKTSRRNPSFLGKRLVNGRLAPKCIYISSLPRTQCSWLEWKWHSWLCCEWRFASSLNTSSFIILSQKINIYKLQSIYSFN